MSGGTITGLNRGIERRPASATAASAGSVALLVKELVAGAGLDPAVYSSHSPRAGLVTAADIAGARPILATSQGLELPLPPEAGFEWTLLTHDGKSRRDIRSAPPARATRSSFRSASWTLGSSFHRDPASNRVPQAGLSRPAFPVSGRVCSRRFRHQPEGSAVSSA